MLKYLIFFACLSVCLFFATCEIAKEEVIPVIANTAENELFRCSSDHAVNKPNEFKCQNGTCIDLKYVCDRVQHCPDASDENFCKYSRSKRSYACILPAYPSHGTYEVLNNSNASPGQRMDSFILTVRCRPGYGVVNKDGCTGSKYKVFCVNGLWDQNMPQCVRFCRLDPDSSVRYMCHMPGVGFQVCDKYVAPGTLVSPICNTPFYSSSKHLQNMNCTNGFWDYVAQCEAECGRVTPEGSQLVIDGKEAKRGELPWHVGIYRKESNTLEQICGGSLVSNNVVISAAHCFWSDVRKLLPASNYKVAVGKLYRSWDSEDEVAVQKSDVKEIKIPTLFGGASANFQEDIAVLVLATPFVYKTYIKPVCLNFDDNFERLQLQHNNLGKIAGWGLTAANGNSSPILKVVDMPFVTEVDCINTLPPHFREYITGDKFCAGYTNGTALCKGDSGGGLAFVERVLSIDRFYLRGIASTAPRNDDKKCNDNVYTTFTKITKHQDLINGALAESARRRCPFYLFQCDDGTCVDLGADCNGQPDCADGSDESDELCRPAGVSSNPSEKTGSGPGFCILPSFPDHGRYVVLNFDNARPRLENLVLIVICSDEYEVMQENGIRTRHHEIYCINGVWYDKMPKCVRAECIWEGIKGQCVPPSECLTALDNTLKRPKPPLCSISSNDTHLVCCTDCELIKDSRLLLSDPVLGLSIKTGTSKAKDKCLEYLNTLDYPCKKDSSLRNITVQLDPVKNCYRKVNIRQSVPRHKGRRDVLRGEFPHMVALMFNEEVVMYPFPCSGAIISERFVLTTRICLHDHGSPVKYIAVGILKRSDPPETWQRYNVKRVISHPQYDTTFGYHNIGLLETDTDIAFSSAVLPACLQVDDERIMHAYFVGRDSVTKNLESIYHVRFSDDNCERVKRLTPLGHLYENTTLMCYVEKDNPHPDPPCSECGLLQSQDHEQCVFTLIGVCSVLPACTAEIYGVSVYMRVKYYVPWIEEIVWP